MKLGFAIAAGVAMIAPQAQALSCLRPDAVRSYIAADQAEERYVVMVGAFDYAAVERAPEGVAQQIAATFTGQPLGAGGYGPEQTFDVTINLDCAAVWCGGPPPSAVSMLAFIELTDSGYVLTQGPCGGAAFPRLDDSDVARVQSCMAGGACSETLLR